MQAVQVAGAPGATHVGEPPELEPEPELEPDDDAEPDDEPDPPPLEEPEPEPAPLEEPELPPDDDPELPPLEEPLDEPLEEPLDDPASPAASADASSPPKPPRTLVAPPQCGVRATIATKLENKGQARIIASVAEATLAPLDARDTARRPPRNRCQRQRRAPRKQADPGAPQPLRLGASADGLKRPRGKRPAGVHKETISCSSSRVVAKGGWRRHLGGRPHEREGPHGSG